MLTSCRTHVWAIEDQTRCTQGVNRAPGAAFSPWFIQNTRIMRSGGRPEWVKMPFHVYFSFSRSVSGPADLIFGTSRTKPVVIRVRTGCLELTPPLGPFKPLKIEVWRTSKMGQNDISRIFQFFPGSTSGPADLISGLSRTKPDVNRACTGCLELFPRLGLSKTTLD